MLLYMNACQMIIVSNVIYKVGNVASQDTFQMNLYIDHDIE